MDFVYIKEWFDQLDFKIDVIYQGYNKEKEESVYLLNGEAVYIETKNEVRPQNINMFLKRRDNNYPVMIASKYITPKAKAMLKEQNVNYIDSFGNVFVNLQNLKLYIEKGNAKPISNKHSTVFSQSGGQVIFNFLKNPELINATQRFLAHISKVSLGSVSNTIQGLIDEGFVVKWNNDQKYQLVNKHKLLDRWIITLNEKILPAYKLGSFTFSKKNEKHWRNQLMHPNILLGGEPAAALLTEYLNPEQFSLFTKLSKRDIIKDLKLLPDAKGEITIYEPFWIEESSMERFLNYVDNQNAVHPLIIYAQLVHSGNSRNLETAQLVYNEYIEPNL